MDSIPFHVIGGFYTLICAVALTSGAFMLFTMRRNARPVAKLEAVLFASWALGLLGGVGILLKKVWGPYALEMFCLTLVVLVCFSMYQRYSELKRLSRETEVNWLGALVGLALVGTPIAFICWATIASLRNDAARAAFGL